MSALSDDLLLIHVTGFFRNPDPWEARRKQVTVPLPGGREADSSITCWVTTCSDSEKAYSLTMLLAEKAERIGKPFDIKVCATDMAERTLLNARNCAYPGGTEAEIKLARLERFFHREDGVYRVRQVLRELVKSR